MLYFIRHEDEEVMHKALAGLGHGELYIDLLTRKEVPFKMRCQVLRNMLMYLMEEEARMIKADQEWKKLQNKEDLKKMGDIQSGVITLILRQGLVHPVQIVPYLISMGTDSDSTIRAKADQQVQELDKKYPGFIQKATLSELIYMADNMAFLPYQVQESLSTSFTKSTSLSQCQAQTSCSHTKSHRRMNLLLFLQVFFPGAADDDRAKLEDDDDKGLNTLLERMPEDTTALPNLFMMSQGCILLLMLKQHLKELYRFTDSKIHRYSPTEQAKVWDKPLTGKAKMTFNPSQAMDLDRETPKTCHKKMTPKLRYPDDDDDIPPPPSQSGHGTPAAAGTPSGGQAGGDALDAAQGGPETGESQDSKPVAVIDLSGDGDGDNGGRKVEIRKAPSSLMAYHKRSMSSHHRHGRTSKSSSLSSKPHKHKKKKRWWHYSEDDDEEDDSEDSDYVV
ncbi:hypothetical protein NP493_2070g00011 [Ridgeia piscesae]|uniref:Nipped-B protein n=1 Tax=Ridgeia piscesae TaxID=27915 RepID=A0AAD9N5T5_RIDPI|nr:hypothetical protein NP493_2070g00011 [Ridgeia piscesae]